MGTLFAYFSPEVQLPLASVLAAVIGFIFLVGRRSIRVLTAWGRRPRWK